MFDQIHEIVFHGKGGYDWYTVYNFPIYLREFTYHKIKTFYEEQNKDSSIENNAQKSIQSLKQAGYTKENIDTQTRVPNYVTKTKGASKT